MTDTLRRRSSFFSHQYQYGDTGLPRKGIADDTTLSESLFLEEGLQSSSAGGRDAVSDEADLPQVGGPGTLRKRPEDARFPASGIPRAREVARIFAEAKKILLLAEKEREENVNVTYLLHPSEAFVISFPLRRNYEYMSRETDAQS